MAATSAAAAGLEIRSLTVRYQAPSSPWRKPVLDRLSLDLRLGDYVVLLGVNGSGKSTLLQAIAGTVPGDVEGEIRWEGRSIARVPPYRRARLLGRVDQDPLASGASHLTLAEHCRLSELVRGRESVPWDRVAAELRTAGTTLEPRQPLRTLSGGQRQFFLLLLATLSAPEILLLDEPTSALDSSYTHVVLRSVDAFAASKPRLVIFVTHDLDEAINHGNRVVVLGPDGNVVADVAGSKRLGVTRDNLVEWLLPKSLQRSHTT